MLGRRIARPTTSVEKSLAPRTEFEPATNRLVQNAVCRQVADAMKQTFEISAAVQALARGSLAAEFERSLKAPRLVDRRV
jgi:hypothetical protein